MRPLCVVWCGVAMYEDPASGLPGWLACLCSLTDSTCLPAGAGLVPCLPNHLSTYGARRFHISSSEWDRVWSRLTIVPAWRSGLEIDEQTETAKDNVTVSVKPRQRRIPSSHRFPYGYLVTTSPQSQTPPWYAPRRRPTTCVAPVVHIRKGMAPWSDASGETYSQGVTGGMYRARVHIHRGMLIRDY